ncbi:MAG: hypothetical protein KDB07_05880, partial [Planctomycetes bacterium]|nr:hypothetical protein [Planctomycetota bacterium]
MRIAPRHFVLLLCAAALLSLGACHERGGFQNFDTGNQVTPLQLPFSNLPTPMIGSQVNIAISATGGQQPYTFELVQGGTSTLDPALQVLPTGFIFGTASQPRNYKPIIRVTDNLGTTAQQQFNFAVA